MPILGIENQTENWKTVQSFAPYHGSAEARYRLAQRLLQPLGTFVDCQPQEVQLELFWNGMRDYLKVTAEWKELPNEKAKIKLYGSKFVDIYNELYTDLLSELRDSQVTVFEREKLQRLRQRGQEKNSTITYMAQSLTWCWKLQDFFSWERQNSVAALTTPTTAY